jgi:H+/Cl- antiporter ClcA
VRVAVHAQPARQAVDRRADRALVRQVPHQRVLRAACTASTPSRRAATVQPAFDGQAGLPGLISQGPTWALSALALLLVFKGIAYGLSLGSFRGGPTFPAVFLGAAAGIMASRLPGMHSPRPWPWDSARPSRPS